MTHIVRLMKSHVLILKHLHEAEIEDLDIDKVTHHDIRGHVTYDSMDSIVMS
jgi:hypothetical protein